MNRILYLVAALAMVAPFAPAASALPIDNGIARAGSRAESSADGVTLALAQGPHYQTPGEAAARIEYTVSYRDVADPLGLGLLSVTLALEGGLEGVGQVLPEPMSVTLASDGKPATGVVIVEFSGDAVAWRDHALHLLAQGQSTGGVDRFAEATTVAVPRQVCLVHVDGALPSTTRPDKGDWRLAGAVYVRNLGNGPVTVTAASLAVPSGSTIEPASDGAVTIGIHEEAKFAYAVTLEDGVSEAGWQWRVGATAEAAEAPRDASRAATCGGEDVVRVGDERELSPYYGAPGAGAIGAALALAGAAWGARRRR